MSELAFPERAVWIGSDHPFDLHEAYLCFRRNWYLEELPGQAELYISADSRYRVWVNGQFAGRGPARCYPHAQAVDRLDVRALLRAGANTIAAQVYQPGYSHFAYVHRAAAGLLVHLVSDGRSALVSDQTWRVRRDPSFASLVPRISIYGSGVEERDLRLEEPWTEPAYDDSEWAPARVVAPAGAAPWTALQLSALPRCAEREATMALVETRRGQAPLVAHASPHIALREAWLASAPAPIEPDGEGWFHPVLADGEAASWLFDLGRAYTCAGWIEVESAGGSEQLLVSYAEKLRDGAPVLSNPQTYCRVQMTDRYGLRPGRQRAETFALRGGRFLLFQLVGPTGPEMRLRPRARLAEYPLTIDRRLAAPDPLLAGIISLCEETFRACLLDGFIDTPWREAAQWVGDALPQSLVMAALSDDTRPLRRVIELAAQGAYPDGVLATVVPGEVHAYTVVDYNFIWVELLSLYRRLTGDDGFVGAMWPALVAMLDRFHRDLTPAGLIASQPGRRLFLDWAPLSRREPNAVYNLHYLLALREAVRLAQATGASHEAVRWRARAGALRGAARRAFWRDGRIYDDTEATTFSQLSAALACLSGAALPGEVPALLDAIAARSLDPDDSAAAGKMVLASPFMHHYVFEALRQGGRPEQVVEIIRRRWGRWVQAGAATTWENWNVDFPDGSQCHAFSAHPRYHLAEIAREHGGL